MHSVLSFNGCLNKQILDTFWKKTNLWLGRSIRWRASGWEGVIGRGSVINTECSKRWNLALPFFFSILPSFHPLLSVPVPHYLSPLSHHCCDYGCHAAVKRPTINRPEIKPKNEFPQRWPHALLSRNYLAGWLVYWEDSSRNTGEGKALDWQQQHSFIYLFIYFIQLQTTHMV